MMNFIKKIGNIKVFTKRNADKGITVIFMNESDVVMKEVCFTNNENEAITHLFWKLDIYTEEWIRENINIMDLIILSKNTYRAGEKDYFCRIDDTQYFKHFCKSPDEFITDKSGMRIIDR